MTASPLVPASAFQISGVSTLSEAKPLASAKAFRAFCAFSPSLPSISPGENRARSRRTWSLTTTASTLSSAGSFARYSAPLMAAASRPAPRAGNTSQVDKIVATNRRIIRQPPANLMIRNWALASSTPYRSEGRPSPPASPLLLRPLHRRLFDRLFGIAEVMSCIDQRDVGQRLREIAGLAPLAGIELLRQQAEIVGNPHYPVEQRLRLGDFA